MKQWIKKRVEKAKNLKNYTENKKLNQKINVTILIIELLFMLWAVNTLYGCPCALRTCDLRSYTPEGGLRWEATNLDCAYVQKHLNTPTIIAYDLEELHIPNTTIQVKP
jgi:hypothetical protein